MSARRGSRSRPRAPSRPTSPTARTSCRSRPCSDRRTFPPRSSARSRSSPLAGESAAQAVERFLGRQAPAAGRRQLRAPARRRGVHRRPRGCVSRRHGAGHEPRTARRAGRAAATPCRRSRCRARSGPGGSSPTSDAVALFCERARAHDPDFDFGGDSASAVAEICRRVDGLPLAIELAAARCGLLSPAEIAARLQRRARRTRRGPARRARPPADAARDDRLEPRPAQRRRASVLRALRGLRRRRHRGGGEAITGAGIDTLDRLVAKSLLVRRHAGSTDATRLGMLETIRAYAAERFAAISDCESVRERHSRYFQSRRWTPRTRFRRSDGPNRGEHLAALDAEIENLRAALQWAVEQDITGQALEMAAALLIDYWMRRDRYAEAVALGRAGAAEVRRRGATPRCALAHCAEMCWPLWAVGRGDEGPALLSEAEAIARTLSDPLTLAVVLFQPRRADELPR